MKYKVDFKKLSRQEKIQYIWDYYKIHIIVAIVVLYFAITTIAQKLSYREPLLNVLMLNYPNAEQDATAGFEEFFDAYGYEKYEGAVICDTSLQFSTEEEKAEYGEMFDYQNYQVLYVTVGSEEQDVLFGNDEAFMQITRMGVLADLSEVLSEELLEKYAEQLIYTEADEETAGYPCAVKLTENQWLESNQLYEECYFGIFQNGSNPERAVEFAEFLLSYK